MVFFLIEKHRNVSWRNKKRPFRKSVLCHPGYCRLKWGRGRAFKIETIKVGREALLKGWGVKIQKSLCAIFDQIVWRLRHRYKERCANMQRRPEAKHCSSLCSQSEGDEYCGGQTRLKIQRRYALKRWLYSLRVRGPHFASKVSYNAGAATDDYVGQCPCKGRIFRVGGNGILKDCRAAHAALEGQGAPFRALFTPPPLP